MKHYLTLSIVAKLFIFSALRKHGNEEFDVSNYTVSRKHCGKFELCAMPDAPRLRIEEIKKDIYLQDFIN